MCSAPNLRMALPLYVARTVFGENSARMESYGPGGGPLGVDNYARGFGLVPEPLRPVVLWGWNRTQTAFALSLKATRAMCWVCTCRPSDT